WFGGWDGLERGSVDRFITEDLKGGRLPEVIRRGEPAILVGHWPGFYFNGEEVGFTIFREVVARLKAGVDNLIWMKLSEIARYWAARELTRIDRDGSGITLRAPFACPAFTIEVATPPGPGPGSVWIVGRVPLREVASTLRLGPGTWARTPRGIAACFD